MKSAGKLIIFIFSFIFFSGCVEIKKDSDIRNLLLAIVQAFSQSQSQTEIIAVGSNGRGFYSRDGFTWEVVSITGTSGHNFFGVTHTGQNYVAVGTDGVSSELIYFSSDGKIWNTVNQINTCPGGGPPALYDVAHGNGFTVAVGRDGPGSNCVLYSTDHGRTWYGGGLGGITQSLGKIVFSNSFFYAVHGPSISSSKLYRSINGSTWTQTSPNGPLFFAGKSIDTAYSLFPISSQNKIIVAGAKDDTNSDSASSFSTDNGATWTFNTTPILGGNATSFYANAMAYNESRLVAVANSCYTDYSDDTGVNWQSTIQTMGGCSSTSWNSLVYDGSKFIAGGQNTGSLEPVIAVSAKGAPLDWTVLPTVLPGGNMSINDFAVRR